MERGRFLNPYNYCTRPPDKPAEYREPILLPDGRDAIFLEGKAVYICGARSVYELQAKCFPPRKAKAS